MPEGPRTGKLISFNLAGDQRPPTGVLRRASAAAHIDFRASRRYPASTEKQPLEQIRALSDTILCGDYCTVRTIKRNACISFAKDRPPDSSDNAEQSLVVLLFQLWTLVQFVTRKTCVYIFVGQCVCALRYFFVKVLDKSTIRMNCRTQLIIRSVGK